MARASESSAKAKEAAAKKPTEGVFAPNDEPTMVVEEKPAPQKKKSRKFEPSDLISCRSVTAGGLITYGNKTKIRYKWYQEGDILEMEYQDLLAMKLARSRLIYQPHFLIEDDELLEQWKDVKKIYDSVDNATIQEILDLDKASFELTIQKAPDGIKSSIKNAISQGIADGSFDSIAKTKIADKVFGTELINFLNY